ncbi:hypothetical protein AN640_08175 [Candidatus Epulonipiscium fishelsonii]|uniref:Uncharacterized protein n=1 Tax=Candidatus Epulonipiscium fishelsonii TaxID=77094 RepID=A0ACC8XE13_9FIRM|nr:hypothetical protein AN640_08175 [Epulopiscium sp. SCG-D08WGA-EpuloA1]
MLWLFLTYSYFLGLRTLTVIDKAIKLIKANHQIEVDFGNYDNKEVFELISSGNTEGIFQLESQGMKIFMRELCPSSLEDIIAGVSLYRPGPMDFIPKYIEGKKDVKKISYTHPKLKPILENTYGCIVYQEQVMQIVRDLAGYSLSRSDLLRRAMGKKKTKVMEKEREIFLYGDGIDIVGAVKNGIAPKIANDIFNEMVDFAKYAFNKSHATCYAIIAYQTAYLKALYNIEFMAALMSSVMDNHDKISQYIESCKRDGIKILPPDINTGFSDFTAVGNEIQYGLASIKNVGRISIDYIVQIRDKGKFTSLKDFCTRTFSKETNKRCIESLILAGAFDKLGGKRKQYFKAYEKILKHLIFSQKNVIIGQMSMFNDDEDNFPEIEEFEEFERQQLLELEKNVLGVYISGHPLDKVNIKLNKFITHKVIDFKNLGNNIIENQKVIIGGIITQVITCFTQKNQQMAFIKIEDLSGSIEGIVFPNQYNVLAEIQPVEIADTKAAEMQLKDIKPEDTEKVPDIKPVKVLVIEGFPRKKEDATFNIIVSKIKLLPDSIDEEQILLLNLCEEKRTSTIQQKLIGIFANHKGNSRIKVTFTENGLTKFYPNRYNIKINDEIIQELTQLLGSECIVVTKIQN